MSLIAQTTLGYHADEKGDDEGEHFSISPGYMWNLLNEPNSNYEKKKRRARAEKEKLLAAKHSKKVCPAMNLHAISLGTKTNNESSNTVATSNDNEAADAKVSPCLQQISKLVDARLERSARNCYMSSVQFNREGRLVLAAGSDGNVRLSQINSENSNATRIQTVSLPNCEIRQAAFMPNGSEVIAVDSTKFIYSYDLMNNALSKAGPFPKWEDRRLCKFEVSPDSSTVALIGNNRGYILLISPKTKEKVGVLRMDDDSQARSVSYTDCGNQLLGTDHSGRVYLWDLRTGRCVNKTMACMYGAPLCTSLDGSLFAVASSDGFVNIYDRSEFASGGIEPVRVIDGFPICTSVEQVKFNHAAQLLAMISRGGAHMLKLVHLPSCTVSSGTWPKTDLKSRFPCSMDFSPCSGLMAVGTFCGKALLCAVQDGSSSEAGMKT
ncbi:unnamed protein product [Urochloa decumbens]|uniref:Uncharacterized protein n=1 Tax=Urochloa decumbens TaxID=240449 RepID=A0ABC9C089_9POAL